MFGGNVEAGVVPTLGATAFDQAMENVNLEVPLITYAMALMNHTADFSDTCQNFYTAWGFTSDQVDNICASSLFNTIDFKQHFYLVTMYFF